MTIEIISAIVITKDNDESVWKRNAHIMRPNYDFEIPQMILLISK